MPQRADRLVLASLVGCLMLLAACGGAAQRQSSGTPVASDGRPADPAAPKPDGNPQTAVEDPATLPFDPAVTRGQFDNGLTYYIRQNPKPENRANLWLVLNAGAIQEDEDQRGLAHFVEHMAFNGTKNFKKQEIVDFLERIGMRFGPDVNAYTSFDETVYMLKVPTDDQQIVDTSFRILEDWAHGVAFDGEEIDKERGVVLEEWRLGRGASARMRDEQFPILFQGSRYAERLPIGKPEILENAPHETLRRFYRDWYRPDLMAVIAVGDFDPDDIRQRIEKHFAGLEGPDSPRPRELYPVPDHEQTLWTIATDPEATRTTVAVYQKMHKRPQATVEDYRRSLMEGLYNSMINARLDELRQQAEPPFLYGFASTGSFVRSADVYFQSAGVQEGGLAQGLDAVLTEVARVERFGFTGSELERSKKELLRGYEQAWRERDKRQSTALAREIQRNFLVGEPMPGIDYELELVRRALPTIDVEELNGLAQERSDKGNRVIMVNAPEKEGVAAPSREALLPVFQAVMDKQLEPYVDQVREGPLVAEKPEPGTVVAESTIEELGVTEWTLSNGIKVVMKPTDFKNDQILLSGFSPGGTSLVDDEQYTSAAYATSLLGAGGLGEFDRIELDKALAGKVVRASAYIGELEEGLRGSCSPEDVETMFELLYLNVTAPRRDPAAVAGWLERSRGFIANRLARPETVFRDELGKTMSQDHPRRQPPSEEQLEQVDLDTALAVYRDRFLDAGDFTFVLVGNFEPETIRPHVLTYLGGLPSAGRQESWRDIGVRRPPGVVRFEVLRGLEDKSSVSINFHGPAEWSRQAQHDVRSLAAALRIRLREVLREDLGGTYGVSVGGSISRRPVERYGLRISFGCAPESLEELIDAVFAEIESIKANGVEQSYVDKVREAQIRQRETDLKENRFWQGSLAYYYRYEMDPRLVLAHAELVESVTSDRIQATVRRLLNTEQYVMGRLLPEQGSAP